MKCRAALKPPPASGISPGTAAAAFDIAETGEMNPERVHIAKLTTESMEMKCMRFFAALDLKTCAILLDTPFFGEASGSGVGRVAEQIGPTRRRAKQYLEAEYELAL